MGLFDKFLGNSKSEDPKPDPPKQNISREEILAKLAPYKRKAYFPVVREIANTFSPYSKMGGFPYLRNESDWPVCPNCSQHMQLFVQLDMNTVPERKSSGLIQLFYCTNLDGECEGTNDGYEPFSTNSVRRLIEVSGPSARIEPTMDEIYPEKLITAWEPKDDYPNTEEFEDLGIDIDLSDEVNELLENENLTPLPGDKLFGWPYWVQGVEYPADRKTGKQMELIFQIDSEVNLPYMFGDSGVGHLTQSPDDKNELAFGWACC